MTSVYLTYQEKCVSQILIYFLLKFHHFLIISKLKNNHDTSFVVLVAVHDEYVAVLFHTVLHYFAVHIVSLMKKALPLLAK